MKVLAGLRIRISWEIRFIIGSPDLRRNACFTTGHEAQYYDFALCCCGVDMLKVLKL